MTARRLLATVLAACLIAAPAVIEGQDGSTMPDATLLAGPGAGWVQLLGWIDAFLALDLNERQLTDLERILAAELPAIGDVWEQMSLARRQLVAGAEPGGFDADAVRRFAITQAPLYVELVVAVASLRSEVTGLLTPAQRRQLEGSIAQSGTAPSGGASAPAAS